MMIIMKMLEIFVMYEWLSCEFTLNINTGSGALPGLMLDLGLLKIRLGGVFFPISSPCWGL